MRIIVASTSPVKLNAVQAALDKLNIDATIVCVASRSKVNQQPIEEETMRGARNRFQTAWEQDPKGDLYIAIESGLIETYGHKFFDRAIVYGAVVAPEAECIKFQRAMPKMETVEISEPLPIDAVYVEAARKVGFSATTVGKEMHRLGKIKQHDDPHTDLAGKSRGAFIADAVEKMFVRFLDDGLLKKNAAPKQPLKAHASTSLNGDLGIPAVG